MATTRNELREAVEFIKDVIIARVTDGGANEPAYRRLRAELMSVPAIES